MKSSDSIFSPRARAEINPAWVDAPFRVDFLFCFEHPRSFKRLNRKRRLKFLRRWKKKMLGLVRPPKVEYPYREADYIGEMQWITHPKSNLLLNGFPMAALLKK